VTREALDGPPTFFECATAVAFDLFRAAGVDIAVLEVGLGGRLDATNVVTPIAAAITSIDFDHQAQLGDSLAAIAREKAGVIKPGIVVVCGELPDTATRVIAETCAAQGAPMIRAAQAVRMEPRESQMACREPGTPTTVDVRTATRALDGVTLALAGRHQIGNATVAVALLGGALVQSDRDHRREAILDPLTGLLNRSALAQRFSELTADSRDPRNAGKLGLLIGDLDHFKLVNDQHGHAVGDVVLKDVGYTLRKHLRALDNVYRVGGEEFVVLLPGAGGVEGAYEVAERLREAVEESRPAGLQVSISFGAVASDGRGSLDFDRLYRDADVALYEAKQAGRNCVSTKPRATEPIPA